jgi:cytochrome c553
MRGVPADLDGPDGQSLGAWLDSLAPEGSTEGTAAVTTTWPRVVRDPGEGGDRARAQAVWNRACATCHGAIETAAGRISTLASVLPRDTVVEHCDDDLAVVGYTDRQAYIRAIVTEKTRHGSFLGYAGVMPPFSTEALSDGDMRDLAAFFRCP